MTQIDFATYCHQGDMSKLHKNFKLILDSHKYDFDHIHVVYQRCVPTKDDCIMASEELAKKLTIHNIPEEAYDGLLEAFGIPSEDEKLNKISKKTPWFYKHHTVNHLCALKQSTADYIVFSDSDCIMVENKGWIEKAVQILQNNENILIVSPGDGAPGNTQIMSQQLFIANRKQLIGIDWNCWDGKMIRGGPFKYYYGMIEGRIGMYMIKNDLYRNVLDGDYRYYHDPDHHKPSDEFKEALKGWK